MLKRAGEAPGELAGRLSGPFQARTQAYLSLCGTHRLAQGSIEGSARTLFAGFQPLIKGVAGNSLRIIVYRSIGGWRRTMFGAVPQFEVAQDALDDGGAVDQADDFERAAATPANQRVRQAGKTTAEVATIEMRSEAGTPSPQKPVAGIKESDW